MTMKIFVFLTVSTLLLLVSGCATQTEQSAEQHGPIYFPSPPDEPRFVYERTVQSSSAIEKADNQTRMRQILTGESSLGKVMSKPFDVAVCQGIIFVSDTVLRSVLVFDIPGQRFLKLAEMSQACYANHLVSQRTKNATSILLMVRLGKS